MLKTVAFAVAIAALTAAPVPSYARLAANGLDHNGLDHNGLQLQNGLTTYPTGLRVVRLALPDGTELVFR